LPTLFNNKKTPGKLKKLLKRENVTKVLKNVKKRPMPHSAQPRHGVNPRRVAEKSVEPNGTIPPSPRPFLDDVR